MMKNKLDKTGDMAGLFDMLAEAYGKDEPLESKRCRKIAQDIRDDENDS